MRIVCSIFFLLFLALHARAKNNFVDSMVNIANNSNSNPSKQSDIYADICHYLRSVNIEKSKEYGRIAIAIAKQDHLYKALAKAYINTGYTYAASGEFDEAFLMADSALTNALKVNDVEGKFFAHELKGEYYRRKAKFEEALKEYQEANKIAEESNNQSYIATSYNSLGVFYNTIHELDKAEQYHLKALEIRKSLGNINDIYNSYENLGIMQRDYKNYDKALAYYFKAEAYALKMNDSSQLAFTYNDIGAAYSFKGDCIKAEKYLKLSIAIRERINEKNELAYTYNYLGENYERKKDLKNAEANIRKALAIALEIKNTKQVYEAYESLSDFFARNKKYDSAYHYAMIFRHFKDSIIGERQKEKINELSAKYENEKKENRIKSQQFEIIKRNYWIAGIAAVLLIGIFAGVSSYKRMKLQQETKLQDAVLKQQELATKGIIAAEENERKRIATDLHDGVGQMMSAAKLNLSSLKNEIDFNTQDQLSVFEKALDLVDESCKEVRAVSHNIMPNALLKAGLTSAIREFIDKIDKRVLEVNLYTEGIKERMDADVEMVLYRVIQECVNNVIKHSGAHKLDISLINDSDGISATIEDNGHGFDVSKRKNFEGMGLKNIINRIKYLKGTVEWDSGPGKGTVVAIHIPEKLS